MDIEEWKRHLEGAKINGWCHQDVHCQICDKTGETKIVQVPRTQNTLYHYICEDCLALKLGLEW